MSYPNLYSKEKMVEAAISNATFGMRLIVEELEQMEERLTHWDRMRDAWWPDSPAHEYGVHMAEYLDVLRATTKELVRVLDECYPGWRELVC